VVQLLLALVVGGVAIAALWVISGAVIEDNLRKWAVAWVTELESLGAPLYRTQADDNERYVHIEDYVAKFPEIGLVRYYSADGVALFEHRPVEQSEPLRGAGMPPLLEHANLVQAELPVGIEAGDSEEAAGRTEPLFPETGTAGGNSRLPGAFWPALSLILAVILGVQLWMLWQTPGSPLARWTGAAAESGARLDPNEVIQVVSRDMHAHPSLDDAVVVSTVLRNRSETAVPYPVIELRFYDASQQLLGIRRVAPGEYLQDDASIERGLQPGVVMPLLLEFALGTSTPAGFQLRFF